MTLTKIDIPLEGETIELGERTVHPMARLHGWYGSSEAEIGGAGGWLEATPTEAIIRDGTNTETRIPIRDETEPSIRKLLFIALAIGIVSQVIILLTLRRRGSK